MVWLLGLCSCQNSQVSSPAPLSFTSWTMRVRTGGCSQGGERALGGIGTGFKQPNHAATHVCNHSLEPTEEERAEGPKRKAWGTQLSSLRFRARFIIRKWRQGLIMTQGHKAWRRSQTGDQRPSAAPLTVLKKEAALGPVCDWGVPSPPQAPGPSIPPAK